MTSRVMGVAWMLGAAVCLGTASIHVRADAPAGTLRVGLPLMPDTLDPARSDNMVTGNVMAGIYDALYTLDPLARPPVIVPLAATALPEVSADYRTFTIAVRRGIFFTPHPAFGGKPRELTAADFAYSIRRILDPKLRSPALFLLENKIEGLDALAARARSENRAIDYAAPVAGLVVVDRQTLRIHLNAPDPIFPFLLASPNLGAIAQEVVEAEGNAYGQRPIGTGAYLVAEFTPGQRLVLRRNPGYRARHWEDLLTPASRAAHASHPMRGRKLPGFERVEFSYTPEASPELLALQRGELDLIMVFERELVISGGKLKPELAARGLKLARDPSPTVLLSFFSMKDPTLGGNGNDRIALRRAIQMAIDDSEYIRVLESGDATVREQVVPPGIEGHIDAYRSPNAFNPAAANALLDRFGYKRGRDGYRRMPDGSALVVTSLIGTSSTARKGAEFTKRMLDRIGVRTAFEAAPGAERLKRMNNCRFGMATMDWGLDIPDGTNPMAMFYSKAIGAANMSCYVDPEFDAAYEKALVTPPGPARLELFRTMQARLDAYAPMRPRPVGDTLLLKRGSLLGPFGTVSDWLQLVSLAPGP